MLTIVFICLTAVLAVLVVIMQVTTSRRIARASEKIKDL